jgi:hypothetical protein
MWVNFSDTGRWRLWIVPKVGYGDKREFYRIVAATLNRYPQETEGLDVGSVEMVKDDKPLVKGMRNFIHAPGIVAARLGGNTVNGVYLPEGVLLRSNL